MSQPTRLHFWRRVEGALANEVRSPRPLARIRGRAVEYHVCGLKIGEMKACLACGVWHWKYLGKGVIETVDGVAQYPMAGKEQQRATR